MLVRDNATMYVRNRSLRCVLNETNHSNYMYSPTYINDFFFFFFFFTKPRCDHVCKIYCTVSSK